MKNYKTVLLSIFLMISAAGSSFGRQNSRPLIQLNAALQELTAKVSPAVVQIVVSGYGLTNAGDSTQLPIFARQQGIGSGVIVDPGGYIITNAHVVKGAERIQVVITTPAPDDDSPLPPTPDQSILPATVIGTTEYFDLALLKVEATGLPTLPFADFKKVTQGELVVAIGSPMGLDNSATMGVISSVARQADSGSPIAYVQTDAPINPGNSGGALVDVQGNLVGINTFILTQSGGSEGLGFALPAPIVNMVYQSLRQKGHVDRRTIGIGAQQITPTMAQGLSLSRVYGLIVCDVLPDGPAEEAGMKIGDVILEADGRSVTTPPQLDGSIYTHDLGQPLSLTVLRGNAKVKLLVKVDEEQSHHDPTTPTNVQKNMLRSLGIMAANVLEDTNAKSDNLRIDSGVVVIARTADPTQAELEVGDVIHAVNNNPVADIEALRSQMDKFKHGDAVVLQVERGSGLQYISFEAE